MDCIIGSTGCIGRTLIESSKENKFFEVNSKNINKISKNKFGTLYCAAPGAEKWLINKDPKKDLENIAALFSKIKEAKFENIVLISTIDVYRDLNLEQNEDDVDHSIIGNPSYGQNRKFFESLIRSSFENYNIVRLPGIFGRNISKNIIFDLMNENMIENISINSSFQWFDLNDLWSYINYSINNNISEINLFPEPINTKKIVKELFPEKERMCLGKNNIEYKVKTKHFDGGYIYNSEESFFKIKKFVK